MEKLTYTRVKTPLGTLTLVASRKGLFTVFLPKKGKAIPEAWLRGRLHGLNLVRDDRGMAGTTRQIGEYFAGKRKAFSIRLDLRGTEFQKQVWRALSAIPYGRTETYGSIARRIGRPRASRAVGAACGANPAAIIVPCHRVVGSGGSLTGFAGGIAMKKKLLEMEKGEESEGPPKSRPRRRTVGP
ncbi:MAG: methylated-DNA--[protein]-cysteine S-methyltransferase [bacterium]|nr:methylated-DNA--[protein]-cysteine S-methyltransferase [bacterium]